jgi:hypothetical protein
MVGDSTISLALITAALALVGCWRGEPPASRQGISNGALSQVPECETDSLRPSTAAPAEGLWLAEESTQARHVAVLVGPAGAIEGDLRVLRRLEAIEVVMSGDTLRSESSGAAVRLELLPARSDETLGVAVGDSARPRHPVATYAVGPAVLVGAYEGCAMGITSPRLRYLRQDAKGRVVTDVMLRRVSTG